MTPALQQRAAELLFITRFESSIVHTSCEFWFQGRTFNILWVFEKTREYYYPSTFLFMYVSVSCRLHTQRHKGGLGE
jgi:hypothetical protein